MIIIYLAFFIHLNKINKLNWIWDKLLALSRDEFVYQQMKCALS